MFLSRCKSQKDSLVMQNSWRWIPLRWHRLVIMWFLDLFLFTNLNNAMQSVPGPQHDKHDKINFQAGLNIRHVTGKLKLAGIIN